MTAVAPALCSTAVTSSQTSTPINSRSLPSLLSSGPRPALTKVAELLTTAEEDLLAFYAFPPAHRPKLRSTNPLERFNREIGRRTDVVGIFPDDRSLTRLVGMLCLEQNDEWLVGRRYLSRAATNDNEEVPELTAA
jgi:putative transposase